VAASSKLVEGFVIYVLLLSGLWAVLRIFKRAVAPLEYEPLTAAATTSGWRTLGRCWVEVVLPPVIGVAVWLLFSIR